MPLFCLSSLDAPSESAHFVFFCLPWSWESSKGQVDASTLFTAVSLTARTVPPGQSTPAAARVSKRASSTRPPRTFQFRFPPSFTGDPGGSLSLRGKPVDRHRPRGAVLSPVLTRPKGRGKPRTRCSGLEGAAGRWDKAPLSSPPGPPPPRPGTLGPASQAAAELSSRSLLLSRDLAPAAPPPHHHATDPRPPPGHRIHGNYPPVPPPACAEAPSAYSVS